MCILLSRLNTMQGLIGYSCLRPYEFKWLNEMLSSVCVYVESEELDGIDIKHSLLVITSEI